MSKLLATVLSLILMISPIWPLGDNPSIGDPLVIVNLSYNELAFINEGEIQHVHQVASGHIMNATPLGQFTIIVKAKDPYYRKLNIEGGAENNPLGTRWIGFDAKDTDGRTYGIHGTNHPEQIGQYITAGCVRLPNEVIEELYEFIPLGTQILITDEDLSFDELAKTLGAIE
ncbi:L,D-transpeptidase [Alkalihalobacillus alcalophilus ATCC 27647 = CGMCC 1.3604]|uniref:L,D-transpeptidase n=1 Tax=Alkalihalobacillus alcalophilus ATCC 27647 = CGMCC 1.3604 TaxID=1218173 RepID=A0A094WGH7_ALKAL|nr:L,D-transpeptidase [Alkalihalobacillus alcalophilus]KGA95891.1 L,D-transpeptidase [Alkalihalobacillus alcalophilus ATCC 27647 = CGMCC 1.3604]MED1562902.1 L,D-transpeptidase [Alkalihalobacillus alcalophilus]THG90210.1 L,D-transpeptidase [Alkalihalobacillus alcalophilus ATCC 27647 = CGMCC 1.3604]